MQALLVVDLEDVFGWSPKQIASSAEQQKVANAVKTTLKEWRASQKLITFVTYPSGRPSRQMAQFSSSFPQRGRLTKLIKGTSGDSDCIVCGRRDSRLAEFLQHRHGSDFEPAFLKTRTDAFTNKSIVRFFRERGVTEIVLIGCSTNGCIRDSAEGALQAGFNVTLLKDCIYPVFINNTSKQDWLEAVRRSIPPGSGLFVRIV